jgi:hypothetical protein
MMSMNLRLVLRFAARFALVFCLLIAPWPGLEETYAKLFRTGCKWAFGKFGDKGIILFKPQQVARDSTLDTVVYIGNREMIGADGKGKATTFSLSSRYTGYIPTILLGALILATPVPWRRRAWALVWGMLLINVYVGFKVLISILVNISANQWLDLFVLASFYDKAIRALHDIFVVYIGPSLTVAVCIWILVTFRREDWQKTLKEPAHR